MRKSGGLFGSYRPGAITIVDAPISRQYARKAKLTFYVVGIVTALLAAVALSHRFSPLVGLFLGLILGVLVGFAAGLVVMVWPVLRSLWHWAVEIVTGLGVVFGWTALMGATSLLVSLLAVLALAVPAAFKRVREFVRAWVWCVIVRHRLRVCFSEVIRATGNGRAGHPPLILAARPTLAGERVWVWLRTGLDLTDLEGKTSKLAVACWASEVRVCRASDHYAALVRVDIARRDPLTGLVSSPLADLFRPDWESVAPVSPGMPPLNLDLDDVPEPPDEPRTNRR